MAPKIPSSSKPKVKPTFTTITGLELIMCAPIHVEETTTPDPARRRWNRVSITLKLQEIRAHLDRNRAGLEPKELAALPAPNEGTSNPSKQPSAPKPDMNEGLQQTCVKNQGELDQ